MENNLQKRYGLPTAICMVIGIVIGSGIFFKTEAVLATTGGNALTGVLAFLVIGVIVFFTAFAFSILAQKYEKVNGLLDYAEATCGPKYAYYIGWYMTMIYTPGIASVLCWVSARYLCGLFGFSLVSGETMTVACLILVGLSFMNAIAPKLASKTQISTTVIKLIPLLLMAAVGMYKGLTTGQLATNFAVGSASEVSMISGLTAAVVSLAFAFEGWILVTSINAELKDSKKNLPLALIFGIIAIVAIYIVYYIGICGSVSIETLMEQGSTAAFTSLFGNFFGTLLTVFIFISCLGTANGLIMANSRSIYSLAARGNGPKPKLFAKVDEETNMPIASAFFGALTCAFWLVYFYGANLSTGWFGYFNFDSSELVIVFLYAFYLPIFAKMFADKTEGFFRRYVVPAMAILGSLFLVGCAAYAHGFVPYQNAAKEGKFSFPILFFVIVGVVVLFVAKFFYNEDKKEA